MVTEKVWKTRKCETGGQEECRKEVIRVANKEEENNK